MNNFIRSVFTAGLIFILWQEGCAQEKMYSLKEVIELAKAQSPFSKRAETLKETRYWEYRLYKSNFNPQLRLYGSLPDYNQDYVQNRLDDGTIKFQQREQTNGFANLGLSQPILLTGGDLSINTNIARYNDFLYDIESWNSTLVNVRLEQPLFSFNALKWSRRTEPLRYEESKRTYVEEMERISSDATDKFFSVLDAQINLQIAEFNLANNDTIYKIAQGRYNIGTTPKDNLLQAELQLLRSRQDVTSAKISLENAKLDLRSFIGLNNTEDFQLLMPENIPAMKIDIDAALAEAKNNRANFIAFQRRRLEAEQNVAQARGRRFQATLAASYGLNNQALTWDESYNDPLRQQRFNLTFNVPILDWGRNKSMMKTAYANKKFSDYVIAQDEVIFDQEIITQVRQFDVLISQLEITKKSDEIAQERYLVSQNRYLIGKVDITNLNIALTEKDSAKRSYLAALRSFWTSYYNLRRLTLFDFANNQRLYTVDQ
jgi:outer membrane protein TolC